MKKVRRYRRISTSMRSLNYSVMGGTAHIGAYGVDMDESDGFSIRKRGSVASRVDRNLSEEAFNGTSELHRTEAARRAIELGAEEVVSMDPRTTPGLNRAGARRTY